MNRFGISRETIRTFLSPVEGGGSGLGPDALSAYSDYAFEMLHPLRDEADETDQMFPGGNTTIARLMLKALIPAAIDGPDSVEGVSANQVNYSALDAPGTKTRIRVSSTAISVQHDGEADKANFRQHRVSQGGQLYRPKHAPS